MEPPSKRILLVEDDRVLRRACEASLERAGFTDLLMPKLSGVDVLRALKADAATRAIPVLELSNSSREEDVAEIMRLGAVGYLVKAELSLTELGRRVAALLAG